MMPAINPYQIAAYHYNDHVRLVKCRVRLDIGQGKKTLAISSIYSIIV